MALFDTASLTDTVGFNLLGEALGNDVESAIRTALTYGAVFPNGESAISIFRKTLATSIRNIESDPRGKLFQRFLLKGPYECEGAIPTKLHGQRLTDRETSSAIVFIYSFMVNSFKGAVTELLASAPCVHIVQQLRQSFILPSDTRVYVGDTVMVRRKTGRGVSKGADLHILIEKRLGNDAPFVTVAGVAEVKSGRVTVNSVDKQVDGHILRCKRGLRVDGVEYPGDSIGIGYGPDSGVLRITVQPSDWKLPRTFRYEVTEQSRFLHMDPSVSHLDNDQITRLSNSQWHITLKWSKEAIAAAAYEMTFWYMGKVGESIYYQNRPKGWEEMSPAEAGTNAVKMMLYYAILRSRTARENQRAIALYNSYGFGYALGMNFKNKEGRREMLWPQDLDEIHAVGKTKYECRIR